MRSHLLLPRGLPDASVSINNVKVAVTTFIAFPRACRNAGHTDSLASAFDFISLGDIMIARWAMPFSSSPHCWNAEYLLLLPTWHALCYSRGGHYMAEALSPHRIPGIDCRRSGHSSSDHTISCVDSRSVAIVYCLRDFRLPLYASEITARIHAV